MENISQFTIIVSILILAASAIVCTFIYWLGKLCLKVLDNLSQVEKQDDENT